MITYAELKKLFEGTDSYLVGGGARGVFKGETSLPRDWDVLISKYDCTDWLINFRSNPEHRDDISINSFGGFKSKKLNLDVWTGDAATFLRQVPRGMDGIAIHLQTGAVITTEEFWTKPDSIITTRPTRTRGNLGNVS